MKFLKKYLTVFVISILFISLIACGSSSGKAGKLQEDMIDQDTAEVRAHDDVELLSMLVGRSLETAYDGLNAADTAAMKQLVEDGTLLGIPGSIATDNNEKIRTVLWIGTDTSDNFEKLVSVFDEKYDISKANGTGNDGKGYVWANMIPGFSCIYIIAGNGTININFSSDNSSPSHLNNESFTNKYGSPTTKCAHPGCDSYIASSGDTNCCEKHSNRCAECGCYIDEDATWCMECIENAANSDKGVKYSKGTTDSKYSAEKGDTNNDGYLSDEEYEELLDKLLTDNGY